MIIDVKLDQPVAIRADSGEQPPGSAGAIWRGTVAGLVEQRGLTQSAAEEKLAREMPQLHRAYLAESKKS